MAELAWLDGKPRPLGEVGECTVDVCCDGDREYLMIVQADPKILVSAEFLDAIADHPRLGVSLSGGILRIEGADRTVIYRIGEQVPNLFAYYAEWPD